MGGILGIDAIELLLKQVAAALSHEQLQIKSREPIPNANSIRQLSPVRKSTRHAWSDARH